MSRLPVLSCRRLIFAAASGCLSAAAARAEPAELTTLKGIYQTQVEAATKVVNDKYRERLAELMKVETRKGNLDGAVAVRDELARAGAPAVGAGAIPFKDSPFAGTVWTRGGTGDLGRLEFMPDGTWKNVYDSYGNISTTAGTWRTTRERSYIFLDNWKGYPDFQMLLLTDGTLCIRTTDGARYSRKSGPATPTPPRDQAPAKPAAEADDPFETK